MSATNSLQSMKEKKTSAVKKGWKRLIKMMKKKGERMDPKQGCERTERDDEEEWGRISIP
jgi:hypothetical protein